MMPNKSVLYDFKTVNGPYGNKGFSLQEILISTLLLGGVFLLSISAFNLNSKLAGKSHGSERCVILSKTINSRLQEGANSSFINSVGFDGSGHFQMGLYNDAWKSDRLKTSGSLAEAIPLRPADPKMNNAAINADLSHPLLIDESQGPDTWKFNNHLAINNTANNLISFINQSGLSNLCVANLSGEGADVTSLVTSWLPKEVEAVDLQVNMVVDVTEAGKSLCDNLPISNFKPQNILVNYKFEFLMPNGDVVESCEARGTVNFTKDDSPPLTAIRIIGAGSTGGGLCGSNPTTGNQKVGVPSVCVDSNIGVGDIEIEVATFKDTTSCRTCLASLYKINDDGVFPITRAEAAKGTCAEPIDAIRDCNSHCEPSDPGSMFFCRLGEKNWLGARYGGAALDNDWYPCHLSRVNDFDGNAMPSTEIEIVYGGTNPANPLVGQYTDRNFSLPDVNTWARIKMKNLKAERSYQFDVRAVDTSGNSMGPSFCGLIPDACRPESGYGAAIAKINHQPTLGNTRSIGNVIALPAARPLGQTNYNPELLGAFSEPAQCMPGAFNLSSSVVDYADSAPLNSGMGIEVCRMLLTSGSASGLSCSCNNNGTCLGAGATDPITQRLNVSFEATDECSSGFVASGSPYGWCQDLTADFSIKKAGGDIDFGDFVTPSGINITSGVEHPPSKSICGLSYAVPIIDFNQPDPLSGLISGNLFQAVAGTSLPPLIVNSVGYDSQQHSGCLSLGSTGFGVLNNPTHEAKGLCVQAMDVCGRMSIEESIKMTYGIFLANSTTGNLTQNIAQEGVELPFKLGNQCSSSGYAGCDEIEGQKRCYTSNSCENFGVACKSAWNEAAVNPTASQACHDPRRDPLWGSLSVAEKKTIAGERCNTTYICKDSLGRIGPQSSCGSAGEMDPCTLGGTCVGATVGSCPAGFDGDGNPYTDAGNSCQSGSDCQAGSCSGASAGSCQHNGAISCWSNSTCNLSDADVRCQVNMQGHCICPNNRSCGPAENMSGPEARPCRQAIGLCGTYISKGESAWCTADGRWVNWYCGYGDNLSDLPVNPADVSVHSSTTYPNGNTCHHIELTGDSCNPEVDTYREAVGGGG